MRTDETIPPQRHHSEVCLGRTSTSACSNLPSGEEEGLGTGGLLITAARCAESPEPMYILTDNGMLVRSPQQEVRSGLLTPPLYAQ